MISDVPTLFPVTIPVADAMIACVLLLLQVPPDAASVKCVVNPRQTPRTPLIAPGNGFTVTIAIVIQPVGIV